MTVFINGHPCPLSKDQTLVYVGGIEFEIEEDQDGEKYITVNGTVFRFGKPAPRTLKDKLESRDFFDLMQNYRFAPPIFQDKVAACFEKVKQYLLQDNQPAPAVDGNDLPEQLYVSNSNGLSVHDKKRDFGRLFSMRESMDSEEKEVIAEEICKRYNNFSREETRRISAEVALESMSKRLPALQEQNRELLDFVKVFANPPSANLADLGKHSAKMLKMASELLSKYSK